MLSFSYRFSLLPKFSTSHILREALDVELACVGKTRMLLKCSVRVGAVEDVNCEWKCVPLAPLRG